MNKDDLELLRKYLKGDTLPSEEQHIRRWLTKNEDNKDVQQLLQEEWERTSVDTGLDLEEAWGDFTQKVGINRYIQHGKKLRAAVPHKRSAKGKFMAIAIASLVLFFITTALLFLFVQRGGQNSSFSDEETYSLKTTNRGEKLNISLPDGSYIKLNSSTELRIPDNYNTEKERVVYLKGEAFFEIARDEQRPFKVISGSVITEVLGTSFNVNTVSMNEGINVAVITGKVRVANSQHEIILQPKEMSTLGPATGKPIKETFNEDLVTGWRNNLLIFDKVSFDEIIDRMEQWYGVGFIIEGRPQNTGRYSGRFENKSLPLVLEGLGFSSAFEYRIVDKTVYLDFK